MGAGEFGALIAVAVDGSKNSEGAFFAAVSETGPADRLLIIFSRPLKSNSDHYNFVTKPAQARYDAASAKVLAKYSALAAEAKVSFEAMEIAGHHPREAVLHECFLASVDHLYEAAPTFLERALKDQSGYSVCPKCNPYLRGSGRFPSHKPCHLKLSKDPPCPVTRVSA